MDDYYELNIIKWILFKKSFIFGLKKYELEKEIIGGIWFDSNICNKE